MRDTSTVKVPGLYNFRHAVHRFCMSTAGPVHLDAYEELLTVHSANTPTPSTRCTDGTEAHVHAVNVLFMSALSA
jgi:hypothetical protein